MFQEVYRTLLDHRSRGSDINVKQFSQEDALLLLMALTSDLLHLRQALGQVVSYAARTASENTQYNPFGPFSTRTELYHMEDLIRLALDKWHRWFHPMASPEIMALYHHTKMYLSFEQLLSLPLMAGYKGMESMHVSSNVVSVPDETAHEAWHILDSAAAWSHQFPSNRLCPVWFPVVVFHASLAVWAQHVSSLAARRPGYGSARILLAFKVELEGMPWPCCKEMSATLGRLIDSSAAL
jgi:hypothetical protein